MKIGKTKSLKSKDLFCANFWTNRLFLFEKVKNYQHYQCVRKGGGGNVHTERHPGEHNDNLSVLLTPSYFDLWFVSLWGMILDRDTNKNIFVWLLNLKVSNFHWKLRTTQVQEMQMELQALQEMPTKGLRE